MPPGFLQGMVEDRVKYSQLGKIKYKRENKKLLKSELYKMYSSYNIIRLII
jgi:hypothetical protein